MITQGLRNSIETGETVIEAEPRAEVEANFAILHQLLRLPPTVRIVGVQDGADNTCKLVLAGYGLPSSGVLVADYETENTTIVKFRGFRKP